MTDEVNLPQEEPPQLEIFSAIHSKLSNAAQSAFDALSRHEKSRFDKIITGKASRDTETEVQSRDLIIQGESASHALLKALQLLAEDFTLPDSPAQSALQKLIKQYRNTHGRIYGAYQHDVKSLITEIRGRMDNQALPAGIVRAVQNVVQTTIAERVKESITPSFPVRPSFELHLTAPTEHLVIAHLLKDRNLIAMAQSNLTSAYVLDMGYPCKSAEAGMLKQNDDIVKLLQTVRIEDGLKLSVPVVFKQWMVTSRDRMARQTLKR